MLVGGMGGYKQEQETVT